MSAGLRVQLRESQLVELCLTLRVGLSRQPHWKLEAPVKCDLLKIGLFSRRLPAPLFRYNAPRGGILAEQQLGHVVADDPGPLGLLGRLFFPLLHELFGSLGEHSDRLGTFGRFLFVILQYL